MTYNPPKHPGLDDVTGELLERRPDDNPVSIQGYSMKLITGNTAGAIQGSRLI